MITANSRSSIIYNAKLPEKTVPERLATPSFEVFLEQLYEVTTNMKKHRKK